MDKQQPVFLQVKSNEPDSELKTVVNKVLNEIKMVNPMAVTQLGEDTIRYFYEKCKNRYGLEVCKLALSCLENGSVIKGIKNPTLGVFMDKCEGIMDSQERIKATQATITRIYGDKK